MDFTSTDGTATTGDSDYTTNLGTLTFGGANPATQQITVNVTGDTKVEADELFTVDLSFPVAPPAGVSFSDNQGDGNITNDDSATIAINDVTLAEGNAGPTAFTFDVTLTGTSASTFDVDFTSTDGTATTGDSDYTTNLGTLTFGGANPATQQITVNVTGDTKVEADELFTVDLSFPVAPPAGVSFSDNQGDGNITNDDSATIAINDVTLAEGNAGPTAFTFDVTLTGTSASTFDVDFTSTDGTATTGDSDYTTNLATLTFGGANPATQQITVNVTGDTKVEADELFTVDLSFPVAPPAGVSFSDNQGDGNITNDDSATIAINDVTLAEGNAGPTAFTFDVTLTGTSASTFDVDFTSTDGTATTGDSDYTTNLGTLTFGGANPATQQITVNVTGDTKVEADELFTVDLSFPVAPPAGVSFSDNLGDRHHHQRRPASTISINNVTQVETDGARHHHLQLLRLHRPGRS